MLEKLLQAILALTAALDRVSAGAPSGSAAPAATPTASAVTVDQVRDKLKELMDSRGKAEVVKVLAACSAKKLGDVAPDKLAGVMAAAQAALAAPAAAPDLF